MRCIGTVFTFLGQEGIFASHRLPTSRISPLKSTILASNTPLSLSVCASPVGVYIEVILLSSSLLTRRTNRDATITSANLSGFFISMRTFVCEGYLLFFVLLFD